MRGLVVKKDESATERRRGGPPDSFSAAALQTALVGARWSGVASLLSRDSGGAVEEGEVGLLDGVRAEGLGARAQVRLEGLEALPRRARHEADDGAADDVHASGPLPVDGEAGARQQRVAKVDVGNVHAVGRGQPLDLANLDILVDIGSHLGDEEGGQEGLVNRLERLAGRELGGDKVCKVAFEIVVRSDLARLAVLGEGGRLNEPARRVQELD